MDGQSLLPLLRGRREATRHELLLEYLDGRQAFQALRTDRYMFDRFRTGGAELYDLERDPSELHNLARRRRFSEVRANLGRRLRDLARCSGAGCR